MRRIETVIFDASGVLIDDINAVWRANSAALKSAGFKGIESIEAFKKVFKLSVHEFYRTMGVPEEMMPTLIKEFRRVYPKYNDLVTIFPEVEDALKELKRMKIRMAVTSNIPSLFLREHLKNFGIYRYFSAVTGQDDCDEQKPSPKPILVTLEKLKSKPGCSAYVGDMEEDIIAGKRAGVYTFAVSRVGSYHPPWRLKRQNPNFLIPNLNSLVTIIKDINDCGMENPLNF